MNEQETILHDIKRAVLSVDNSADVLLFGSRARGDFHGESDWDILILTNEEVNNDFHSKLFSALLPLEMKHGINVSPIVRTRVVWNHSMHTDLYINIYQEGVVL